MRRAQPSLVPDAAALALVEAGTHGIRITAVNPHAAAEGVRIGQALADARAAFPCLATQPADPRREVADVVAELPDARAIGRGRLYVVPLRDARTSVARPW